MHPHRVHVRCLLSALAFLAAAFGQCQEVGTVTLLRDTPLHIIRGFSVFQAAEGLRLHPGDVVETGPAPTAQVQLEFSGGAIVDLGPSSHAYIVSESGSAGQIVLLSGWLKGETTSGNHLYATPLITATTKGGNILLHSVDAGTDVFVERGAAVVSGGAAPIPSAITRIFFTRRAGKPVVAADRPSEAFVSQMPVCFRDVLPSRLARFAAAKAPQPKRDRDVSYADVEDLMRLAPNWRRGFAERFRPRLEDTSFREAITAHIASLPEWKPVLYPDSEKPGSN